jgi:myo-inositol 2-dehydrogenase / D-chiro-inositol 1-dehydrogenase
MRFAVIGAGRIGRVHARNIAEHPEVDLVLCADPVEGAAAALAGPLGARATTEVREVFGDRSIDAVVICSPTPFHVDQILAGVQAGKAVLVEKPVDLDLGRVDQCIAALAGSEHRVMVGFNRRFDAGIAEVRDRIDRGEIGPLEQLTIVSRDPAPPPPAYIAQSGGIFRDMTIHDFDMARFMLGDIETVSAVGQSLDPQIRDAGDYSGAVITLTARSGAIATIVNSRHSAAGYDQRLEAFGPSGALETTNRLAGSVRFSGAGVSGAGAPYLDFFLERYADAYRAELQSFLTAIRDGIMPTPSLLDGREALVLADAAAHSAATGERVLIGTPLAAAAAGAGE